MSQQSSAYQDMTKRSRRTAIAQVAAHRLISKAMQLVHFFADATGDSYNTKCFL